MNTPPLPCPRRRAVLVGGLSAAVAAAWLFVLSGLTGVVPGAPLAERINVLFQSDSAYTIEDYVSDHPNRGQSVHRLIRVLYTTPVHVAYRALCRVLPREQAVVVAGRAYNALIAGLGVGCLVGLALRRGQRLLAIPPLLTVNLLATSMVLVAVPEHFGVSYGLLSMTFLVAASDLKLVPALALLGVLTVIDAGVTVTNGLFPLGGAAVVVWRRYGGRLPAWFLKAAAVATVVGTVSLAGFLWHLQSRKEPIIDWLKFYFNLRLVQEPAEAGVFAYRGIIDPVIGPTPVVHTYNGTSPPMVSYEPDDAPYPRWPYDVAQSAGVACWAVLLGISCVTLFRSPDRPLAVLLIGWIAFNLFMHNLWGLEFFLYSTHWAWALSALVLLGARSLPPPRVALLCLPLAGAQVLTLTRIWAAVATISA